MDQWSINALQEMIACQGISNSFSIFLYCLNSKQWHLTFTYLLFQIHLPTGFSILSLSHLNIISSFIISSFLSTIFFNEKCYVHNIFCNTFTTKFMWKVVTSSNLKSPLKLFFYSPILTNNNLLLKIYYKNIVVTFLN